MTASTATSARPYDLVLFGATGYTGRLVAEYLARSDERRQRGLRWALAGRNPEALASVRAHLAAACPDEPALAELPLLHADSGDPGSLGALVEATRVVCTTVGPYARHGLPLVGAAAAAGTDYCDLTGETTFMRAAIDQYDALARNTGARIVPACGFDSIPSDLGVWLLGRHFQTQGRSLARARLYVEQLRGGISGGTAASMVQLFEEASHDPGVRRLLRDPLALVPGGGNGHDMSGLPPLGVGWDGDVKRLRGPFVMAIGNAQVVRRSNALLDFPHGHDFRYDEVSSFAPTPRGFLRATGMALGLGVLAAGMSLGPVRRVLARRLPQPGSGPSAETRASGSFRLRIVGHAQVDGEAPLDAPPSSRAEVRIEGRQDPGYAETSKMLAESALCLALDALPARGGLLTPSVCMGEALVDRLRRAGMVLEIEPTVAGERDPVNA